jgi:ribosomal protein S6
MEKTQTDETKSSSEDQGLVYELAFHLLPTLSDDEGAKIVKDLKALLEKNGATIISEEAITPMQLAYTFVKRQEGKNAKFDSSFFGVLKFDSETSTLDVLKEELDLSKNVLRYLIIKTVREYPPIQSKVVFREIKTEEPTTLSKPKVEEKSEEARPISEEELDKTIEELVSEDK